ncbi:BtrH N-terminal domain-containing protein [Capnocytophaga catalasegens]|uniref:Peptidase n=1 Tax=Capnocytophaga catalasegens TaxID=1004260 RepID=A0AAV5ATR8_9FLAO|nr:BtrH N-terminal domain-containing protein [Capnocytophaga catalasegens]GIZ14542.1 peptidase [Capnocytophaga catalasegens]GJM50744.1 peptidase [Capnocytophaga catalasegens]GJM51897.1 peptidase [Capnocytophaga catalasegens]
MELEFEHKQSAHCENGVASNLLHFYGMEISEPMVFGIGAGLFFFYFPLLKVNQAPAISFRTMPGYIFSKAAKRLGFKVKRQKFSSPEKAQKVLDENLSKGNPVGLQVGVYDLTYFPDAYRFHFNAHNLCVYGKKNDIYLISDPVMPSVTTLSQEELERVRFAKGTLAPKGHLYYPIHIPSQIQWEKAIKSAIKEVCQAMLSPVPIIGVKAIKKVSRDIPKWATKKGTKMTNYYLAQLIRMQEEIGTGGGGFRFIYAAFLQEASEILQNKRLRELSHELTNIGDLWREFAVNIARVYKNRSNTPDIYNVLSKELAVIAQKEELFFRKLKKSV